MILRFLVPVGLAVVGAGMVVAGIALLYPVAGLITAGLLLAAAGLLVDFDPQPRRRRR